MGISILNQKIWGLKGISGTKIVTKHGDFSDTFQAGDFSWNCPKKLSEVSCGTSPAR
jgi:hypothetical protein